jgi:hypothetical protein
MPIPRRTAPSDVPLKMLSYCSTLRLFEYGCREMRRKVVPVTNSHAPNRNSYRYLDNAFSVAGVDIFWKIIWKKSRGKGGL